MENARHHRHTETAGVALLAALALAALAGCSGSQDTAGTDGSGRSPAASSARGTGNGNGTPDSSSSGSGTGTGQGTDQRPGAGDGSVAGAGRPGGSTGQGSTPTSGVRGSAAPRPTRAPGPVVCSSTWTRVVLDRATRSGGTLKIRLKFTNRGMSPCLLRTAPFVTFLGGMGERAEVPVQAVHPASARVVLGIGNSATALVRAPDSTARGSACQAVQVSRISVRMSPDDDRPAMLTYSGRLCSASGLPTVIGAFTRV